MVMLSDYSIFSFEIDTLEIVLKEQVDVVDKFFLGRQLSNNQDIKMFDNLFLFQNFLILQLRLILLTKG